MVLGELEVLTLRAKRFSHLFLQEFLRKGEPKPYKPCWSDAPSSPQNRWGVGLFRSITAACLCDRICFYVPCSILHVNARECLLASSCLHFLWPEEDFSGLRLV